MQQIYTSWGFRGYVRYMNYISDIAHLTPKDRSVIEQRIKILAFFDRYGPEATQEAFDISRSTIFLWQQKLRRHDGRLSALKPGDRTPHRKRTRTVPSALVTILKKYRTAHPGVGKETLTPAVQAAARALNLPPPSESTVGRVLKDLKDRGELLDPRQRLTVSGRTGRLLTRGPRPRPTKLRPPKGAKPTLPGERVQIDAIIIFVAGLRRYILTALDVPTRFAFAYASPHLTSTTARDFFKKLQTVAPFPIRSIQTDNGSEFHKDFDQALATAVIPHYWNYPHFPKGNAYVERFNRTIQEQHVSWHLMDLADPTTFNQGLMEYLVWYNTVKPHRGIGRATPMGYYLTTFIKPAESNMLWTLTLS